MALLRCNSGGSSALTFTASAAHALNNGKIEISAVVGHKYVVTYAATHSDASLTLTSGATQIATASDGASAIGANVLVVEATESTIVLTPNYAAGLVYTIVEIS